MDFLPGKKTHIVAAGIVLSGVGAFLSGEASLQEAVIMVLNGLGFSALRIGVKKGEKQ